ncbi:MAG: pilus assembly protein PilP [Neisseria sp.]|nr:pilus assembly protein PilP [Neisseria sp.]
MKKILLISSVLCLAACDSGPAEDLQSWMSNTRKEAQRGIKPAEIPTGVPMMTYTPPQQPALDAFNSKRLTVNQQKGLNAPDMNRPKEILEGFPLNSLKYVGSFTKNGKVSAFVEVEDHVYTVGKGNYLGQNYGRITEIRDDAIVIAELVEDADGNWVFRPTELVLNSSETGN